MAQTSDALTAESFASQAAWRAWLDADHAIERGIWLMLAKQASGMSSVTYAEAVDRRALLWLDRRPEEGNG